MQLEIPSHPNTLLKQEGLQLAGASFRDVYVHIRVCVCVCVFFKPPLQLLV